MIPDPLDRARFPTDEWALVEAEFLPQDLGRTETLFSVANGYLGLRGTIEEGDFAASHGTFVNGFHETWPIRHAEDAYGFAHVGQTIVNAPDPTTVRLYIDEHPFQISTAELLSYQRRLDFRTGLLTRDLVWRTPSGHRVRIQSTRMVSFVERHLALVEYQVTLLDQDAPLTILSQLLNRQDAVDDRLPTPPATVGPGFDPRRAEDLVGRVLLPRLARADERRLYLGYRTAASGMAIAVAADHSLETGPGVDVRVDATAQDDVATTVYRVAAHAGSPVRLTKLVAVHTSRTSAADELARRCDWALDRARTRGVEGIREAQRIWLADFWQRSDVELAGQPELQQAVRWNLFQLIQASARADGQGIPAKGLTGSGYSGHYFWDSEIYVVPFLTYTSPMAARNALRFRYRILDHARLRAMELSQLGALFPWRTINGQEASAFYAAGTAQYHIDADVAYAIVQYVNATGDTEFLDREGIDILVETARMWADLGFWRQSDKPVFHIHGVTGPDEYTTVVNDNLYTNVMARANLRASAAAVTDLRQRDPEEYAGMVDRLGLTDDEVEEWSRAAEAMFIPFDENLRIHPQDAQFLERELWDLAHTPADKRPLMLHYHPLVIYRFQVLKQADVVLALILQGDQFTAAEKLADFDYYDPITTGDSTLSAVAQSIIAAEVGYSDLAVKYFCAGLFVDLADLHSNASDGVHVASTGGVWSALAFGFGGLRDHHGELTLDPRLPRDWESLRFRIEVRGSRLLIDVGQKALSISVETGDGAELTVRGTRVSVAPGRAVTIDLEHQGRRRTAEPTADAIEGELRPDGTVMTATIPTVSSSDPLPATIDLPAETLEEATARASD